MIYQNGHSRVPWHTVRLSEGTKLVNPTINHHQPLSAIINQYEPPLTTINHQDQAPLTVALPDFQGAASCGVVLLCAGAWCLWNQAQEVAENLGGPESFVMGNI